MDLAAQVGTNDHSPPNPNLHRTEVRVQDPDDGKQRFLLELECIQCLANYLAQNRYFEVEAFIGYLKYLKYWQKREYLKYIMSVPVNPLELQEGLNLIKHRIELLRSVTEMSD